MMNKTYSELIKLENFKERFEYLKLSGYVGEITHGGHRHLNQKLYSSNKWRSIRRQIIIRDNGCDLADSSRPIYGKIYIHHINPITIDDMLNHNPIIFNPENLITVSKETHEAIHYSNYDLIPQDYIPRSENDTCPWR